LRQHSIEVTNAEPSGIKIVTNSSERVPKGLPISSVWGAIDTRKDPRGMRRVRKTPCRDSVLGREKAFKFYTWSPRESKTSTRTTRGNLRDKKETKSIQSSRYLGGEIFVSERKSTSGA
jgi:hypothetical protein